MLLKSLNNLIILVVIISSLYSCKQEQVDDYPFLRENSFFPTRTYDSIIDFYDNNRIKLVVKKNRNLSLVKKYYENGRLKSYQEFFKDKLIGNQYYFYETGRLQHYNYIDEYDVVCFVIKWDEKGKVLKKEGVSISPNITLNGNDRLTIGDTLDISVEVPSPPYTKSRIYGGVIDRNMNIIDSSQVSVQHGIAIYKWKVNITDTIYPFFYGVLYDEKNQIQQSNFFKVVCNVGNVSDYHLQEKK